MDSVIAYTLVGMILFSTPSSNMNAVFTNLPFYIWNHIWNDCLQMCQNDMTVSDSVSDKITRSLKQEF